MIGFAQELPDVSPAVYERIERELHEGPRPEGLILHASGIVNGAVRMLQVWESEEHRRRFVAERVEPARKRAADDHGRPETLPPHEHFEFAVQHLITAPTQ